MATTLNSSEKYSKQNYNTFLELVNLKKGNTVLIKDLLNSKNTDLKMLKQAKNTQDFINYKLSKYNISKIYKLPLVNIDLSSRPDKQNSKFVKFNLFKDENKKNKSTIRNFNKFKKINDYKDLNSYNFITSDYYSCFKSKETEESYCQKVKNPTDIITPLNFYNDDNLKSCEKKEDYKKKNNKVNNMLNDDHINYQYIDEQEYDKEYEQVEDDFLLFNPVIKNEEEYNQEYDPYSEY